MKVTTNTPEKKFEPINLNITIESADELYALIHRMNASVTMTNKSRHEGFPESKEDCLVLYRELAALGEAL